MSRKYWVFTVEGPGMFPLDMLRYDACHPASSESVGEMVISGRHGAQQEKHQVSLISYNEPTVGRWESFGWKVISKKKV